MDQLAKGMNRGQLTPERTRKVPREGGVENVKIAQSRPWPVSERARVFRDRQVNVISAVPAFSPGAGAHAFSTGLPRT